MNIQTSLDHQQELLLLLLYLTLPYQCEALYLFLLLYEYTKAVFRSESNNSTSLILLRGIQLMFFQLTIIQSIQLLCLSNLVVISLGKCSTHVLAACILYV
jgi:hypothetical protein